MWTICENNRDEIENEFLALLLNKPNLLELTVIKPQYLHNERNKKMLEYIIESYKDKGLIDNVYIREKHEDFDIELWLELFLNTVWHEQTWKQQLEIAEESIIKFYKEDIIKKINTQLKEQKINYDEFMIQMKKLDEINPMAKINSLTTNEIIENINVEKTRIVLNNFKNLDNTLKLVQGDFLVIGATTGAGKSGFLLNLMNDIMEKYQCIYFNMEMSKSTIYKRIIAIHGNLPIKFIEHPESEQQAKYINQIISDIEKKEIVIEHKANDIKGIKNVLLKLKDKSKHTVIFIDHLGLTKTNEYKKSLYEQITEVAKELRQICLDYDCTVIGASQLNRTAYNTEEKTMSMLKDSGELENSASKIIIMSRSETSDNKQPVVTMNLEVAKNRDGMTGVIQMSYDKTKQIFKE